MRAVRVATHSRPAPAALIILACGLILGCGADAHAGSPGHGSDHESPATSPATSPTAPHSTPASDGTSPPAARPDDRHGAIEGLVVHPAGHDPRSGGGLPVPVSGDPIEVRDQTGHLVATTITAAGGHFRLLLRPGQYQITEGTCATSKYVDVEPHATATLTLTIRNNC